jgi:hypothetical protein
VMVPDVVGYKSKVGYTSQLTDLTTLKSEINLHTFHVIVTGFPASTKSPRSGYVMGFCPFVSTPSAAARIEKAENTATQR